MFQGLEIDLETEVVVLTKSDLFHPEVGVTAIIEAKEVEFLVNRLTFVPFARNLGTLENFATVYTVKAPVKVKQALNL